MMGGVEAQVKPKKHKDDESGQMKDHIAHKMNNPYGGQRKLCDK